MYSARSHDRHHFLHRGHLGCVRITRLADRITYSLMAAYCKFSNRLRGIKNEDASNNLPNNIIKLVSLFRSPCRIIFGVNAYCAFSDTGKSIELHIRHTASEPYFIQPTTPKSIFSYSFQILRKSNSSKGITIPECTTTYYFNTFR